MPSEPTTSLTVYAADLWQHVCPMIRLALPADRAGFRLIHGAEWENNQLCVYPERVDQADVVVITRDFPRWAPEYERVLETARARKKTVVYELDDLLLELPAGHPDYERYSAARSALLKAVVEADAVVGSTPPICDYLGAFNPNVRLWENYLDDSLWSFSEPRRKQGGDPVRIGYMGGHSHAYDLEPIVPTLEKVLRKYPRQAQMVFWGLRPPENLLQLPNVEWVPVALVGYRDFVAYFLGQTCDVFIAPLQDNLFNHSKSHLKFLEYSALGAPGIYSRVTPYERVIRQGENGFLAADPDEWEKYLAALIDDPELRLRMGTNAQKTLLDHWKLSDHVQDWAALYGHLGQDRPPGEKSQIARSLAAKMYAFQQTLESDLEQNYRAKTQLKNLQDQLAEKDRQILELGQLAQECLKLYQDMVFSQSWRMMDRLIRLRLRLAPHGSLRRRLLGTAYRSAVALKNRDFRAFLRQIQFGWRRQPAEQPVVDPAQIQASLYTGLIPEGAVCPSPAITILIVQDAGIETVDPQQVQTWAASQTIRSMINLVLWDKASAQARILDGSETRWSGWHLPGSLQNLGTKYVCIASQDLLRQEETYLETNLLALESEQLAFTINLRGEAPFALEHLGAGNLPGDRSHPLLRMVVRVECLQEDLSLDLAPWQMGRPDLSENSRRIVNQYPPVIAGKVIPHTAAFVDTQGALSFENRLAEPYTLRGRHLLLSHGSAFPQAALSHLLTPVHRIISPQPLESSLPTVFVVMPFLAVGGAEKIALKVMENLAGRVRFIVLAFDPPDPGLGTTIEQFRQVTSYVYPLPDFLNDKLNESIVEYLIGRFDPRAIYIANGTPWIYEALGDLKHRHPSIRIVNQVYDHQVGWINRYDAALVAYLDAHVGSNPKICQAYLEKGALPEQVFFIENGTDPKELDPGAYDAGRITNSKIRLGLPPHTKVVTFASRLNPQKRPLDFVELSRRFAGNAGVTFLMVGDGPLAQTVDEQIAKIGTGNLVRHPFYRPINDVLAVTDVLVLPSEFEGMPMIILETQTMGKPVVATDVGNVRQIIERTGGGVVVPQIGDISALMAGVQKMLDAPPPAGEIRRHTLVHFDWKVCAEKHLPAFFGPDYA